MGSQLHQALRNLCLNTGWKYAVFWKLKHHHSSETLLSWEDTYCDNDDYQQSSCPLDSVGNLGCQLLSDDALGLALAEMTCHVYSLGEGVVGNVAFTGKHFWVSADKCAVDSSLFFQCFEGWQSQYSAGIKTVAVVAVIPYGVVQLGSLDEIPEDLSIVDKVREAIYELQDSFLASEALTALPYHMESSCMLDISTKHLIPVSYHGLSHSYDRQIGMCSNISTTPPKIHGSSLSDSVFRLENYSDSSDIHGSITHGYDGNTVCAPENVNDPAYMLWSGYELSEALGPALRKQNADMNWSSGDMGTDETTGMVAESLLTENSETSHLLEAVVANSNKIETVDKRNHSFLISDISSNREIRSEPCSSIGSLSHETFRGLNSSGSFAVPYSKGISSSSCSRDSDTLEMARESRNIHKKRAKPGVNGRPRPRDRQLIQDRIKELRELVPNGSKCSIDSLLEQTIKHMMFMQSIVKQAEKLNICIKPKSFGKEPRLEEASCTTTDQQGSSWAVEMDNQKACPIIVENVNMHGQMLVEMMCGDGSRFLEISEAICSMGLTILKGDSEPYGEKTWIRFVVQDENKRRLHRMDILWSLIQLLQTQLINI